MPVISIRYDSEAKVPENTYEGVVVAPETATEKVKLYHTGDIIVDYAKACQENPNALFSSTVEHFVLDSRSYRFNVAGLIVLKRGAVVKPKPKKSEDVDLTQLRSGVIEYINAIDNDDSVKDFEEYIFEDAVKAFYGKDIFDWVSSRK